MYPNSMAVRTPKIRCLLIALGQRGFDDHLTALAPPQVEIDLIGVCDIDSGKERVLQAYLSEHDNYHPVKFYTYLDDALDELEPTMAIVATPHDTHLAIARTLLARNIPFLKEKPFALNLDQAQELSSLIEEHGGNMRLCVQRRFHPLYVHGKRVLPQLGSPRHFSVTYHLNVDGYLAGWRSSVTSAGGGAVIDMGYHIIDLLVWYFGMPEQVYASVAPRSGSAVDDSIEETVVAVIRYAEGFIGTLTLSLCEPRKREKLRVHGSRGFYILERDSFQRFDDKGRQVETLSRTPAWPSATTDVLADFIGTYNDRAVANREIERGIEVMALIDAMYRSIAGGVLADVKIPG